MQPVPAVFGCQAHGAVALFTVLRSGGALGRRGGPQQAGEGVGGIFVDDQPVLFRPALAGFPLGRFRHDPSDGRVKGAPGRDRTGTAGFSHQVANLTCLPVSTTGGVGKVARGRHGVVFSLSVSVPVFFRAT